MSQYPSPYSPPGILPPYPASLDLRKPARRVSVMMFVLGTFLILISGCFIGMPFLFPYMPAEQVQPIRDRVAVFTNLPAEVLLWRLGGIVLILGVTLVILGVPVRRGGMTSTVLSILLTGLLLLQQTLSLIFSLLSVGSPAGLGNLCGSAFTFTAFLLLFVWLIQAVRAIPKMRMAQEQYLMQYWQYQQNMQTFNGYPTQPPSGAGDQAQSETPISNHPSS